MDLFDDYIWQRRANNNNYTNGICSGIILVSTGRGFFNGLSLTCCRFLVRLIYPLNGIAQAQGMLGGIPPPKRAALVPHTLLLRTTVSAVGIVGVDVDRTELTIRMMARWHEYVAFKKPNTKSPEKLLHDRSCRVKKYLSFERRWLLKTTNNKWNGLDTQEKVRVVTSNK